MKGLVVSVDYHDFLDITLPRNVVHFDEVLVVTAPADLRTLEVARRVDNTIGKVSICRTDAFYRNEAKFNKGLAIEEGLDQLGRQGWLCVFDADIVMPPEMDVSGIQVGQLYCPGRRQIPSQDQWALWLDPATWPQLPLVGDVEFGGYFHLFHADDPALGAPPWYSTNWRHAAGYDSDFIARWPPHCRTITPPAQTRLLPFEVLHIGPPGVNWHGRHTPYLDGSQPERADERRRDQDQMWILRQTWGFQKEKL